VQQEIWIAEMRKDADATLDAFIETYGVKFEQPPPDTSGGHQKLAIARRKVARLGPRDGTQRTADVAGVSQFERERRPL
jgi:hypothetical protein